MKLKVLEEARQQYLAERAWWVENAESGTIYTRRRGHVVRRWLMPKTRYHIYYRFVPRRS